MYYNMLPSLLGDLLVVVSDAGLRMVAFEIEVSTLRLAHPQLFDRHRKGAGHRNDDGECQAEDEPERHVGRYSGVSAVIMSNEI